MAARRAYAERHSRLVGVLRVTLPLAALVLLSLVFLLASQIDPTRAIPLAEIDVTDRARDPRISGASFAGVTEDGAALRIVTQTARTDPLAMLRFEVTGLELHLDGPGGEAVFASAQTGSVDRRLGWFDMRGGVQVTATPGYAVQSERIAGALDITRIEIPMPVSGSAPAGQITAGNLSITAVSRDSQGYMLVFGGGVRLLYHPENPGGADAEAVED